MMGLSAIGGVRSQHVPGYPSAGQIHFYVYFPAAILALVIAARILASRRQWLQILATPLITLALFVLPVYLLFYTGGM